MKQLFSSFVSAMLMVGMLSVCAHASTPPGKSAWQQQWENVVAKAKKEGQVTVYVVGLWGAGLRSALNKGFKERYGIELQFMPFTGGSDLVAKVTKEQSAGMYAVDTFGAGITTFALSMKPAGLLGPIEPLIFLPEVTDGKAWEGGEIFTADKEHMMVNMGRSVNRSIFYNKNLVKEIDIVSYKDLLKPQFKGNLICADPTQSGPGAGFINRLCRIFGFDGGLAFLRDLLMKQDMVIQRNARLQTETVARGKYAVGLAAGTQYLADFLALGAPLAIKVPKEGDGGSASFGGLAVPVKLPHPNATTVFVNWLLTKEGQSLFAKHTAIPSRRLDVSTEGIDPVLLPLPGEKVAWDTTEDIMRQTKVMTAAKEILDAAQK